MLRGAARSEAPLLLRDHLRRQLEAYFSLHGGVVGTLPEPLRFSTLLGRADYEARVAEAYAASGTSWFTPSTLFQPYYARALAKHMLRLHDPSAGPLLVTELGGGSGVTARGVLDELREMSPTVHASTQWTAVDVSHSLLRKQSETVSLGSHHRGCFRTEQRGAADAAGWGAVCRRPCFVLALELLDNLPHDRVVREAPGEPWQETHVVPGEGEGAAPTQVLRPLADPLIVRCAAAWEESRSRLLTGRLRGAFGRAVGSGDTVFLPTASLALLEALGERRPAARLILADFDALPGVVIPGTNAPLVASQPGGGATRDWPSYLDCPAGECDILFPTDFELLGVLAERAGCRRGAARSTAEFLRGALAAAEIAATRSVSGFNPLLDEFANTRVFVS